MKQLLLLLFIGLTCGSYAQIVDIPDANFKNALLNYNPPIDTNNDDEIQVSEAEAVTVLNGLSNKNIYDLTGIEAFVNLTSINMQNNHFTTVDMSNNPLLVHLYAYNCPVNTLNIENNIELEDIALSNNDLSSIDVSHLPNLQTLYLNNTDISSIDVSANTNLTDLNIGATNVSTLDLSGLTQLVSLVCTSTNITELDVTNNPLLTYLAFSYTDVADIDLSNNPLMIEIHCRYTLLTELDLSQMHGLLWAVVNNMPNLTYVNLRNGNNVNYIIGEGTFYNLPNLEIVCVDDVDNTTFSNGINQTGHEVTFTDDCNVTPLYHNQLSGVVIFDLDLNGCDGSDIPTSQVMLTAEGTNGSYSTFTGAGGGYVLYVGEGSTTMMLSSSFPDYFTVTPESYSYDFMDYGNAENANFCVTANQTVDDVDVTLVPLNMPRPGFASYYQLVLRNKGTTVLSGSVELVYDDGSMSLVNSSQAPSSQTSNTYTFAYEDLYPFQTATINLEFLVAAPPVVNIDDVVSFEVTMEAVAGDATPEDNVFELEETVVGSYDPNDIQVLEGDEITLEEAEGYLHYVIRFQNTGTAAAEDVIVENVLDDRLDWSTMSLQSMSHDGRVAITDGNQVQFIFDDIDLPDSTNDEPNSHGFIAYKIKPIAGINLGDIMYNQADIYFDFNEAIITNMVSTEVVENLSVAGYDVPSITLYPNPTNGLIQIVSPMDIVHIDVMDSLGRVVFTKTQTKEVDLSQVKDGIYFIRMEDAQQRVTLKKVVKD